MLRSRPRLNSLYRALSSNLAGLWEGDSDITCKALKALQKTVTHQDLEFGLNSIINTGPFSCLFDR